MVAPVALENLCENVGLYTAEDDDHVTVTERRDHLVMTCAAAVRLAFAGQIPAHVGERLQRVAGQYDHGDRAVLNIADNVNAALLVKAAEPAAAEVKTGLSLRRAADGKAGMGT